MKERFENRTLDGNIKVKLSRSDHPCGAYWIADKRETVNSIIAIMNSFSKQGYRLTLRQLYYQLVQKNIAPNDDVVYKRLSSLLDDCRYSGTVDWNGIEDRGRVPYTPYFEDSVEGALQRTIDSYSLDRRTGQKIYTELWTEKDAISGIIKQAVREFTLTVGVNKGFASSTAIYNAYKRIAEQLYEVKNVVILYLGDHDPSGLDMIRDIRDRLEMMLIQGNKCSSIVAEFDSADLGCYDLDEIINESEYTDQIQEAEDEGDNEKIDQIKMRVILDKFFEVKHIGLTMEQIREFHLPPNPAKITDPRAKKYIEEHGNISWEVDALQPSDLVRIIQYALDDVIDTEKMQEIITKEEVDKQKITAFIETLNQEEPDDDEDSEKLESIEVGQAVHYIPFEGCDKNIYENGMIKSINEHDSTCVFVVFNCNDDWDNYTDYTGESTKIDQLRKGWIAKIRS